MSPDSLSLEKILDLEQLEVWTYRGFSWRQESIRVFGGQVAGQALAAAGRTVQAGRRVHSLHAYFLRPGDTGAPLLYEVEPVRDGRSFSTRRVLAVQHGEVVFSLSASFAAPEDGIEHQRYQPAAPGPEDSADAASVIAAADPATQAWYTVSRQQFLVELRFPDPLARIAAARVRGHLRLGPLPAVHRAAAARPGPRRPLDRPGQPRSRRLVPRAVPGRRLAALRAGEQLGRHRAGAVPGPALRHRRRAGRLGDAGRAGAFAETGQLSTG
jgi:hypothetical protein